MSPQYFCLKCNRYIIGDRKFNCFICKKIKINNKIKYNYYYNSMIDYNLPEDIICIIIEKILINDVDKIINYHNRCWRNRMHNLIP